MVIKFVEDESLEGKDVDEVRRQVIAPYLHTGSYSLRES